MKRRPIGKTSTAQNSTLTGEELAAALRYYGVHPRVFELHTGRNKITINRWLKLKPDDDPMPLWIEWVLMMYQIWRKSRAMRERLPLPREKWKEGAEHRGPTPAEPWVDEILARYDD